MRSGLPRTARIAMRAKPVSSLASWRACVLVLAALTACTYATRSHAQTPITLFQNFVGHVNYEAIPNVVYTWPELASVGLSEQEAAERGLPVRVGRYRFAANGRAKTLGESEGLVKLVAHAQSDQLLGAHIVGPRASDMIAELVIALEFSASAEDIARTVHAHPTLSEALHEAALAVDGRAIHF